MDPFRIRVLCVDDSTRLTDAWMLLFRLQPDMQMVGALSSADTLIDVVAQVRPDIVLMDISMDGRDPLEATAELTRVDPRVRVIFCSGHTDPNLVAKALDAGAWGFTSKTQEPAGIVDAIRRVARGEVLDPRRL